MLPYLVTKQYFRENEVYVIVNVAIPNQLDPLETVATKAV